MLSSFSRGLWALIGSSVLLSCSSTNPVNPATPSNADVSPVPLSVVSTLVSGEQQTVAMYHLRIDAETLAVSVENVTDRFAQASPQAKSFDLELWGAIEDGAGNPFLTIRGAQQFSVTGVDDIPGLGKLVSFTHKHPIATPNYTTGPSNFYTACADCLCYSDTPPGGSRPSQQDECLRAKDLGTVRPNALNRSDLSYSGRAVFLPNVPGDTRTFFTPGITVDTAGVVGPDGYIDARSVINATGDIRHDNLTNTIFPYVLLADETKNNRTGISNGGDPEGNYGADPNGWQRSNIGTGFKGWTGYDVLHAGQTISNSVVLKELPAGGYDAFVALVIKYTDPRGASSLFWRWPTPVADPLQFAYRMPYGALDASVVIPPAQAVSIQAVAGSTAALEVEVRDWDRAATEIAGSDLSGEADVSKVQNNAAGNCVVTLSAPALSATPVTLTYNSGTGLPGDESKYSGTVTNSLGTAAPGTHFGLVKVEDPENSDSAAGTYRFGIDNPPGYTAASPAKALPVVTYQLVSFNITLQKPVVSSVSPSGCPTPAAGTDGTGLTFSAVASNSPTGWNWNFGGGASPNTATDAEPFVVLGAPGSYNGTVTASNGAGTSTVFPFCYVVTAALPQILTIRDSCPIPSGAAGATGVLVRATATGNPTSFVWEFNGGATITAGGTTANVTVTLGAAGAYSGIVTCTNAVGDSAPFSFCYLVTDP